MNIPGTVPCPQAWCVVPMLPEHPHNHSTPARPDFDPMPSKPRTRAELVEVIRSECGAEKPPRTHVRQVPSRAEPILIGGIEVPVLDAGELGAPPWSPAFHRYIGGIGKVDGEWEWIGLDPTTVWSKNLVSLRRYCAGHHATWYEHRARPVCHSLIQLVVFGGYSLGRAALELDVIVERADELLFGHLERDCDCKRCPTGALDRWWAWVSADMNGISSRRMKPTKAA